MVAHICHHVTDLGMLPCLWWNISATTCQVIMLTCQMLILAQLCHTDTSKSMWQVVIIISDVDSSNEFLTWLSNFCWHVRIFFICRLFRQQSHDSLTCQIRGQWVPAGEDFLSIQLIIWRMKADRTLYLMLINFSCNKKNITLIYRYIFTRSRSRGHFVFFEASHINSFFLNPSKNYFCDSLLLPVSSSTS